MKILAISPVLPYPPDDGDRIRLYHFLEQFSKKHEIHLVSFIRKDEEKNTAHLKKICKTVVTVPITKTEIMINAAKAVFSSNPVNVAAYESEKMRAAVDGQFAKIAPDLIFVYRLRMAPYAEDKNITKVIDVVDSMALLNSRRMKYEKNPLRLLYGAIDTGRILKYERSLEKKFSSVFINCEDDAAFLKNENIVVVQNGSAGRISRSLPRKTRDFTAGFFGNMEYPPNLDAVLYFYKNVWKKLKDSDNNIKLVIAGDRKGLLKRISNEPDITVKSYVQDIDAEIAAWDVSIVPVRYGAGRQNKIMKSWSCGVPVVSSVFAAKGVYGRDRVNMLIAKDTDEFARNMIKIKNDKKLRHKIVSGGLATVRKYFDWNIAGKILEKEIRKDTGRK